MPVPLDMQGLWRGRARIIMSWCEQDELSIELTIGSDGEVSGTVGEAQLRHGFIAINRGALGRRLNFATDFIIIADLEGEIVAAEGIQRSSIKLPMNFVNQTLVGGLHTSGSNFGGAESMRLSATSMTLNRVDP